MSVRASAGVFAGRLRKAPWDDTEPRFLSFCCGARPLPSRQRAPCACWFAAAISLRFRWFRFSFESKLWTQAVRWIATSGMPMAVLSTRGAASLSADTVTLRNGIGSALLTIEADNEVELIARVGELETSRTLSRLRLEDRRDVSGDLPVSLTEWSDVIHVTGDLRVPPDAVLSILPGTLILVEGGGRR